MVNNVLVAPNSSNSNSRSTEVNIDENAIERVIINFVQHGEHYADDLSDKMRELSEEQRELGWYKRSYTLSLRDLESEKRSTDSTRRNKIKKRLNELDKKCLNLTLNPIIWKNFAVI